jgi:hypothetical protein
LKKFAVEKIPYATSSHPHGVIDRGSKTICRTVKLNKMKYKREKKRFHLAVMSMGIAGFQILNSCRAGSDFHKPQLGRNATNRP